MREMTENELVEVVITHLNAATRSCVKSSSSGTVSVSLRACILAIHCKNSVSSISPLPEKIAKNGKQSNKIKCQNQSEIVV